MMEIAVAIATAGKAFNYINAAVNKGHEIQDLATKFGAFSMLKILFSNTKRV